MIAAGSIDAPPHLLVVGPGNSVDPGPAWLVQKAKRGARWRLHYDRRSYSIRRHRHFFTQILIVQIGSKEELPYKGKTIVVWPRQDCGGPHCHIGAFPRFYGSGSHSYSGLGSCVRSGPTIAAGFVRCPPTSS